MLRAACRIAVLTLTLTLTLPACPGTCVQLEMIAEKVPLLFDAMDMADLDMQVDRSASRKASVRAPVGGPVETCHVRFHDQGDLLGINNGYYNLHSPLAHFKTWLASHLVLPVNRTVH